MMIGSTNRLKAISGTVVAGMLGATLSWLPMTVSAQDDGFATAEYAPADSLAYITVNLDMESDQWTKVQELVDRSGLSDVAGEEISVDETMAMNPLGEGEVGFVLTDISGSLETVTESVSDPMSMASDVSSGYAMIAQPDDVEALLTLFEDEQTSSGLEIQTVEYGGITISFTEAEDEFTTGTALAQLDDETLVIATIPEDLEGIIDVANGDAEALTSVDEFNNLLDNTETDSLVWGFLNGEEFVAQAEAASPEQLAEIPEELLNQAASHVGFTAFAADAGLRFDALVVPGENAEFPELEPTEGNLASMVPSDSLAFSTSTDLGPSGLLDSLALTFASEFLGSMGESTPVPDPADMAAWEDQIFEQAALQMGFNIKTDVVDQLVDDYGLYVALDGVASLEDGSGIEALFVSGVADEATVQGVIDTIIGLASSSGGDAEITANEVDGGTITRITPPADAEVGYFIEVGIVNGELLIGVNDGVTTYLEGPEEALADSENYTATLDGLPENPTSISFVNTDELIPLIVELVSSFSTSTTIDADPACEEYESQEEAQTAYDEDFIWELDQDFDGEACEDHFNPPPPTEEVATPEIDINILGIGSVTYVEDGNYGFSTLIAIGD